MEIHADVDYLQLNTISAWPFLQSVQRCVLSSSLTIGRSEGRPYLATKEPPANSQITPTPAQLLAITRNYYVQNHKIN